MKRSRAEAGNMVMNKRLTGLALVTGMILLFSSGISIAGTEFKLFHKPAGVEKYAPLEHLKDSESASSVKWLVTDIEQTSVVKFVTTFAAEPFKFAEGIKAALKSVEGNEAKTKFKSDLRTALLAVDGNSFGSSNRKDAYMDLVARIFDAKDLDKEDLLKDLFALQASKDDLALKTENPDEKIAGPTDGQKSLLEAFSDLKKLVSDFMVKPVEKPVEKPIEKPIEAGQPAGPAAQAAASNTGEKNNAAMEQLLTQVCDQAAALQKTAQEQFAALSKQAADTLDGVNNAFNQNLLAQRQQLLAQNQKKNTNADDFAEKVLAAVAADNGKQNNTVTPPPPLAQQAQAQPRQQQNRDDQALPVPPPDQQQQQQQQGTPFQNNLPVLADNSPIRVSTGKLNTPDGSNELDRAETISSAIDGRESYVKQLAMLGPNNVTSTMIALPLSNLEKDINTFSSTLKNTQRKEKEITRSLEKIKQDGRQALNDSDKRREKQYQLEYDEAKSSFESEKQMIQSQVQQVAQSGGDASSYSQQANQYLTQKMQGVAQAKKRREQFDAELDLKVESLNGDIRSLALQRDDLKNAASDLEGKLVSLKSEQSQLAGQYTAALKRENDAIYGNQVAGVSNQQRVLNNNFGGNSNRTPGPGRLMSQPGSQPQRGSLSSKGVLGAKAKGAI